MRCNNLTKLPVRLDLPNTSHSILSAKAIGFLMFKTFCFVLIAAACISLHGQDKNQTQDKSRFDTADLPKVDRKITYKEVGGKAFQLHVFEPETSASTVSNRGCIVFFFGGGWSNGDPKQFYSQSRALADLGMVAMSAEYRVTSRDQSKVIDSIADAQDAVAYVRSHAAELKIDPERIAVGGGSAGGHLAAAVATLNYRGTQPARSKADYRPNALVLFNPALVLAPVDSLELPARKQIAGLEARIGDKPESASPYHHLSKDLAPTIIFHGRADTTVPFATVELFSSKAKGLGVDCRLMGYEGEGHGFFNRDRPKYLETRDAMIQFLRDLQFFESK